MSSLVARASLCVCLLLRLLGSLLVLSQELTEDAALDAATNGATITLDGHIFANMVVNTADFNKEFALVSSEGGSEESIPPLRRPGIQLLGMHRSGTSVLSGLLHGMGFRIGGPLVQAAKDNEKGFFERLDIVLQNDQFLFSQNITYYKNTHSYSHHISLGLYDEMKDSEWFRFGRSALKFLNYRGDKDDVLKTKNIDYAPYLAKDPRLCITLNTWLSLVNSAQHGQRNSDSFQLPAAVFIYRHPLDVASSLVRREVLISSMGMALRLWYIYNLNAIQQSYDLCRVIVSHNELLSHPQREMDRIHDELILNCGVGVKRQVPQQFVAGFVDEKLLHSRVTGTDRSCDVISAHKTLLKSNFNAGKINLIPNPQVWDTSDPSDIAVYRSCILLYCAIEDKSAFSPGFAWDYSIRD
jgi:hypothetical protein